VLDVGCGTGTILVRAREAGHTGRLAGVDPDRAALDLARAKCPDVEWREQTAAEMTWRAEFDLAIMSGHAFQVLVHDDDLRASLHAVRRALAEGGRFAFETRNPRARAWEQWTPSNASEVVDPAGLRLRVSHRVESVDGDVITFTETTANARDGTTLRVDRASLRFLDADALTAFLREAGFEVGERFGGWLREPLESDSREIVTVARAV
jgi:SAM-dependent methyltransferase